MLTHLVTNQIIKDDLYVFLFNLLSLSQQDKISQLERIMQEHKPDFRDLNVQRHFQLNLEDRELKDEMVSVSRNLFDSPTYQPFEYTLVCLKEIQFVQSPLSKLEIICHAMRQQLASDIDNFWKGFKMKNASLPEDGQMMIDIDNLQGLAIYLVWALNYPEILTECLITSEFISEGISQCSRTIFLLLL